MGTHIVQIGKHKFICGLFWQSLSRPRELLHEASELGKRIESDLMVLRSEHAVAQAGFAQTKDGARRGLYSLGAVISKTISIEGANYDGQQQPVHNWLSAFKLPDGMWAYFAVRDANFLPNGDFAGTKEEVLERLHGDYGLGGWNVVIGDPELEEHGFHNFNTKRIEDLIPRKKNGQIKLHAWWALRPVERKLTWQPVAALTVLTAVVAIGAYAYWHHRQLVLQQQHALELARAREKALGNQVPPVESHLWPKIPVPSVLAQACVEHFELLAPAGWLLDEYNCTPDTINYSWSRGTSTIGYLLEQVPGAQIQPDGEKASYSEALALQRGQDEDLVKADDLVHLIMTRLQLLGLSFKVGIAAPLPATGSALSRLGSPPPKPEWKTLNFVLEAEGLPLMEATEILSRPGIRFNKISYRTGKWSIEGVIYAK